MEVFAGTAGLSHACAKAHIACLPPIDIDASELVHVAVNILEPGALEKVLRYLRSGIVAHVHFGTPCASFSMARKNDGGPPPLRSRTRVRGVCGLSAGDQEKVDIANKLLDITVELARAASGAGATWSIENPASSLLWLDEAIKRLELGTGAVKVMIDMCQFGAKFKKPTCLMTTSKGLRRMRRICPGKSRGHQHVELKGKVWDAKLRKLVFKTKKAQVYPPLFCKAFAEILSRNELAGKGFEKFFDLTVKKRKRPVGQDYRHEPHKRAKTG